MANDIEITVYDSLKPIYSKTIKGGAIGERKLQELLKCLTARFAKLEGDEIVGSYMRPNAKGSRDLLYLRRDSNPERTSYSCGDGIYATAIARPRS